MNSSPQKRLYILDSLRGLAALIVCFHHYFSFNEPFFSQHTSLSLFTFLKFISNLNHLAVLFFFALSGFSIGLALKSRPLNNAASLNDYFYRRIKRILPIYLLSILVAFAGGAVMGKLHLPDYDIKNLIGNLLFLQTSKHATQYWFIPYGLNGPLWSLAYEMFFYLFFPIVLYIDRRFFKTLPLLLKMGLLILLSLAGVYANRILFIPYLAFFNLFIIWVLGFLISKNYLFNKKYNLIFISLTSLAVIFVNQQAVRSDTLLSIAHGIFITTIFYLIVLCRQIIPQALINSIEKPLNAMFLYTGKGSFAFYALHYPLLLVLNFYNINMIIQVIVLILLVVTSKMLEEFFIKTKLLFLKINYVRVADKTV